MGTKIATLKTQKPWDGIILGLVFHTDIILLISLMTVMRRRLTIADVQTLVKSFPTVSLKVCLQNFLLSIIRLISICLFIIF